MQFLKVSQARIGTDIVWNLQLLVNPNDQKQKLISNVVLLIFWHLNHFVFPFASEM